jgi:hypothetical protein
VFKTLPFFGVVPEIVTEDGKIVEGEGEGYLVRFANHYFIVSFSFDQYILHS